ncbi:uncharacterized protein [Palaemon carinicauda]|uniref:uncharacterized protein n=1 Tax=Palaemon carinicauda TaxID=392227 RepID=UPI0035B59783
MSKQIFQPNRTGLNKALDQVEEVLEKLKERVEAKESQRKEKETSTRLVDAQTSTTSLCPGYEDKSINRKKNTSVLIGRRSSRVSSGYRGHRQKAKARKNESQTSVRSLKDSHINRRKEGANVDEENRISSGANPSTRRTHRKRTSSFNVIDPGSGRRSVHTDGSGSSSQEILRRGRSQDDSLNYRENISWIPPLSQSSPREGSPIRDKRSSKRLQHSGRPSRENSKASCSNSRTGVCKEKTFKVPVPLKPTIPVSGQSYAEPTLSFKLRTKLTENKGKVEKENVIPYIPSGHTNKSHHVGVIMQQKLGLLKTVPPKELKTLIEPFNRTEERSKEADSESLIVTEDIIRTALNNIHDHIALAEGQQQLK